MYLLHYLIPLAIFYFFRDKIIFWGLMLANIIDLDHVYYRLIGKVGWLESACGDFGKNCSIGTYPLHNPDIAFVMLIFIPFVLSKEKKFQFLGWLGLGVILHFLLDYLHIVLGFGI